MKRFQLGMVALLICSLFFSACTSATQKNQTPVAKNKVASNDVTDLNWKVPAFEAVDQEGKEITLESYKGKVLLVDFIFTRCPNICPPMTSNMVRVQKELKKQNVDAQIISFTADPLYDQPKVLKQFAEKYQADLQNWSFLQVKDLKTVQDIVKVGFKGIVTQQKGPSEEFPILVNHPSQFYLIDQKGQVRKFYDGLKPDPKQITKDAKKLIS